MSNLLAKWAVKYSKFAKIGIVDLDGPKCTHPSACIWGNRQWWT